MIANPAPPQPALPDWLRRRWGLWVVLAAICFTAAVRIRLSDCALERDEGEYAYAGQLMLQGIPPYQLAYNMKFPGTYAAYTLIMAVFGQTPAGVHLGVMCFTSLMALLLYWLGRKFLDETAGAVAGTASVFLSASPSMLGLSGHATHFAAFFVTAGLCLLWRAWQTKGPAAGAAAGIMFGLAMLMKQHAVLISVWAVALLVLSAGRQPPGTKKWRLPVAVMLGIALPFGLTCLLLWRAGVFGPFWFWTIDYAREYVSLAPITALPTLFVLGISGAVMRCGLIWLLALAGLPLLWKDPRLKTWRMPFVTFFVASFLTTCPGFYFRSHYFLLMIPGLALGAGIAVSALVNRQGPARPRPYYLPVYLGILAWTVFENRDVWLTLSPVEVIKGVYGPEIFVEARPIANYIRTNSLPTDRVAVLGSEPEIYFLSGRHSATGYIYTYPLVEQQPFARKMRDQMISEIESSAPRYVVFARIGRSWSASENSDLGLINWWYLHYQTNYVPVGMAELISLSESRYYWGDDAAHHAASQTPSLLLYERIAR